jgi:hypothetical protein
VEVVQGSDCRSRLHLEVEDDERVQGQRRTGPRQLGSLLTGAECVFEHLVDEALAAQESATHG